MGLPLCAYLSCMFDIEFGLVLHRGFAAQRGFPLCGLSDCGGEIVLFAMGRANYQEKPFVDEVISAILGAAVRLLC